MVRLKTTDTRKTNIHTSSLLTLHALGEDKALKLYEGISTGLASILQEKMRSALTMLGIVIGVAAVLAMLAIGDGAKRIVTQEFEKFGGHFTVRRNPWIWRGDRVFPNRSSEHLKYEDILAIEAECPSVECAIPNKARFRIYSVHSQPLRTPHLCRLFLL